MLLCGENVIFAPTSRNLLSNKLMTNLLLLGFFSFVSEWIIIALVILLLFGGKKIPELMRGLGKGVKSFKDGVNEAKDEINKAKDEIDKPADSAK